MFFTSIKEINRFRKEINTLLSKVINSLRKKINRLLSKRVSNIYLKVTKKNWCSQNFDFISLKKCSEISFWGAPTHADMIEFQNYLLQLKNQKLRSKTVRQTLCFSSYKNRKLKVKL